MIPWSLGIRAQKKTTPERNSNNFRTWVSGLNRQKNYCAQYSREESGHYDSLEPGYQGSI